jgi:hypothetical protein
MARLPSIDALPTWATRVEGGWLIAVHAQPGAKKTEIQGCHGGALKIRLHAAPVDGAANVELRRLIAARLGIAIRDVEIRAGITSRDKRVFAAAPTLQALCALRP